MALNKKVLQLVLQEPVIETYGNFKVVREDLMRFLPYIVDPKAELVYGGPFCGGAALALSELGKRTGQKITLFYAAREKLHPRQHQARANGATLKFVRPGYMTVVQARAKKYADKKGAELLHLGFDMPAAEDPFVEFMLKVRNKLGSEPPEVWCAAGSGFLTRCLGKAFPKSKVFGVGVGLASRHDAQSYTKNVTILESPYDFAQVCKVEVPYNSCPNYDRKAWEMMVERGKKGALHWNVLTILFCLLLVSQCPGL